MKGTFQIISWDESAYSEGGDGMKKTHAKITQSYTGFIEGTSELQYLMSYQNSVSAVFVGLEVVTGTIDGKRGSFTLQHNGKFEKGVASSHFIVVSQSGTEQLENFSGSGTFTTGEAGQARYEFVILPE